MVSTTRHPTGQDLRCLVCHKGDNIDIDHVVNRGMGGSKARDVPENKVPLCRECHQAKTMGVLETYVAVDLELDDTGQLNYFWRRGKVGEVPWIAVPVEVSQRYKCLVGRLSDGAEVTDAPASSPGASASSLKEESGGASFGTMQKIVRQEEESEPVLSDGAEEEKAGRGVLTPSPLISLSGGPVASESPSAPSSSAGLTHEQRVAIAAGIKEMEWGRQWLAGDTAVEFIAELGESAEQYISDFGYQPEPMSNIIRVCEAIPSPFRHEGLRFGHHTVVYDLNREDMEMWLDRCVEEGWSVAEFRRQVKGTRARVKRWTLEALGVAVGDFEDWTSAANPPKANTARWFWEWLGEQE